MSIVHNVMIRLVEDHSKLAAEIQRTEPSFKEYVEHFYFEVSELLPSVVGRPDDDDLNGQRMYNELVEIETLKAIIGPAASAEAGYGGVT